MKQESYSKTHEAGCSSSMAKGSFKNFPIELFHNSYKPNSTEISSESIGYYRKTTEVPSSYNVGQNLLSWRNSALLLLIEASKLIIKYTVKTTWKVFCFPGFGNTFVNGITSKILFEHTKQEEHSNGEASDNLLKITKIFFVFSRYQPNALSCIIISFKKNCFQPRCLKYLKKRCSERITKGPMLKKFKTIRY